MMLEQLKYKNHMNEVFEFGKNGIFVNINDLHDYEWSVTKKNNKIAALTRGITKSKLPITIICDTEAQGTEAKNRLMEVAEKDVLALQQGQVILGNYYFKCFVTKSQKKKYLTNKRYMEATLTLTSDYPYWVKETSNPFTATSGTSTDGLDYNYDYPYDHYSDVASKTLINSDFVSSNFKIVIYGACTNPSISIANHIYQVNCEVADGEYLTIDSTSKKIYLTGTTGTVTNVFNSRNKNSYIFEKIPPGSNLVAWDGDFGFDVVLMEERSEPKWT